MVGVKVEQQIIVKFHMKLGITESETYNLLKEVFGNNFLSRACVFERHKAFSR